MEQWKDVAGYEGRYQVSSHGRIKSLCRKSLCKNGVAKTEHEKIMAVKNDAHGYPLAGLRDGKRKKFFKVHRLVAIAFLYKYDDTLQVNHKNGTRTDNNLKNLEWVTASENVTHSFRILKRRKNIGERNGASKLTREIALYIRKNYIKRDATYGLKALADKFSVSHHAICDVISGRTWAWIGGEIGDALQPIAIAA